MTIPTLSALLFVAVAMSCGREPTATIPEPAAATKPDPIPVPIPVPAPVATAPIPSYALRVLRPAPALTPDSLMTNLLPIDATLAPGTPPG